MSPDTAGSGPRRGASTTSDDEELRIVSDAFLARLERLHDLESEKRLLMPGTPEILRAATEIEALAREVLGRARQQTELTQRTIEEGSTAELPIEAVAPRDPQVVLSDWREAERALRDAFPQSAEWAAARADVERLREEYRRSFEARR